MRTTPLIRLNGQRGWRKKKATAPTLCIYLHAQGRDQQANPIKSAYGCRCLRIFSPCPNQRRPSLLHNRTSSGYTAGQDLFPPITTRSRHSVWQGRRNPILSLITEALGESDDTFEQYLLRFFPTSAPNSQQRTAVVDWACITTWVCYRYFLKEAIVIDTVTAFKTAPTFAVTGTSQQHHA